MQKSDNTVNLIFLGIVTFMILRLFFIHPGSGILETEWPDKLTVLIPGGKRYNASLCRREYESGGGNYVKFTAIGIDLSLGNRQILTPVVVRCKITLWVDYGPPLP